MCSICAKMGGLFFQLQESSLKICNGNDKGNKPSKSTFKKLISAVCLLN